VEPPRVRTVISKYDRLRQCRQDFEISNTTPSVSDPAISVKCRKVMDITNDKKYRYSEVDIDGSELRKLLDESMVHIHPRTFQASVTYTSPFQALIYNWDNLVSAFNPCEGNGLSRKDAREDLSMLLKYIRKIPELEGYFKTREMHIANKTIELSNLWTLFALGTFVYAKSFFHDMQMFECQGTAAAGGGFYNSDTAQTLTVFCAAYDWDGTQFRRYTYKFIIKKFDGPRAVKTHPYYPVQYYQHDSGENDDSSLRKSLIERGRMFFELCTAKPDRL
jgi:hypothetical protein